jgi:hypothetical protein
MNIMYKSQAPAACPVQTLHAATAAAAKNDDYFLKSTVCLSAMMFQSKSKRDYWVQVGV